MPDMNTTTNTTEREVPTRGARADRARGKKAGPRRAQQTQNYEGFWSHEHKYDLLTAAVMGAAIGAGAVLMLKSANPSNRRRLLSLLGRGASMAGLAGWDGIKWAGENGVDGLKYARKHAKPWLRHVRKEIVDSLPPLDKVTDEVGEYLDEAKEAIENVVLEEISDFRKAVRRKRRDMGI